VVGYERREMGLEEGGKRGRKGAKKEWREELSWKKWGVGERERKERRGCIRPA
jgi:hypothetical protein